MDAMPFDVSLFEFYSKQAKINHQHIHTSPINAFSRFSIRISGWFPKGACFNAKQEQKKVSR